jgi:sugar transferase (PEP-CTERM/EpsH1 system associated)
MQLVHSLSIGGSERLACDLAQRFDRSRIRSSVCAVDYGGPLADELGRAGIPSFVCNRRPGFDWRLVPGLLRLFRRERVDFVQTHHLTQLIYGGLAARAAGARLVHVEHSYLTLGGGKAKRRLRVLARLADHVVAVGREVEAFLVGEVRLPPEQVRLIWNGVDLKRYSAVCRKARSELGLPEGPIVGHVGRLEAVKDQRSLLSAFRSVRERRPDARLVIVGDGSLRAELEAEARSLGIEPATGFLGARGDVTELLPHFEVFVLCSRSEGLPLALLEAMAAARPVVATAVGAIPQVVVNETNGCLVPPGDARALAEAIVRVLSEPAFAAALGRAARRTIEERFNFDRTVADYQRLYARLGG